MFLRTWDLLRLHITPLHVPWKRRLETLAVIHFVFMWMILPILSTWVPFYFLFYSQFWWAMLLYFVWHFYDFKRPRRGSRGLKWYKNHALWRHFADYFPLRLVKTADLDPERNFILGCHPHGALSVGAFTSLLTNGTGFDEMFPGIQSTLLTLNGQFYFPFRRDVGIALGGCESSKESLAYLLKNPGKGRAVGIVVGGATEALDCRPGLNDLNLLSRRGFCKYAIIHGADLVPTYSFGENDIYEQYPNRRGSALRNIQQKIKDLAGFCPPLLQGRGIFNYTFGILPYRRPITTVVGKPIPVEQNSNPTAVEIDALHSQYCSALVRLFEENKHHHKLADHVHLNLY